MEEKEVKRNCSKEYLHGFIKGYLMAVAKNNNTSEEEVRELFIKMLREDEINNEKKL